MVTNQFQTEWIATHLLFPNSTQARDIFSYVISGTPPASQKADHDLHYFKKICQYFYKIQPVSSTLIFSEFSESKISLWPTYFKKLNNEEKLLLVGFVFCELSENKLSIVFKCSESIIRQKIKNAFYKIIPKNETPVKTKYQFTFKKYNSESKSDFFIYDDIIDDIFQPKSNVTSIDKNIKKTEQMMTSAVFIKYASQIQAFKDELQSLKKQKYDILSVKNFNSVHSSPQSVNAAYNFKKYVPLISAAIAVISVFIYRPQFVRGLLAEKSVDTIEIQQIKIDRQTEELNNSQPANTSVVAEATVKPENSTPKTSIPAVAAAEIRPQSEAKAADEIAEKKSIDKNKSGGLYRGRLTVTDIQQVINVAKEKIINLGGQKAGEVELGWMKNEGTSYFHFSFPDENKSDLEIFLKQFGSLELVFEPHPRVMPKGFKRYIIEIKQNE